jgi:hypothetical protein
MIENSSDGGGRSLYFIVGGLVVAVAAGAFAYSNGYLGGHGSTTVTEKTTSIPLLGDTKITTTTTTTKP